LTLGARCAVSDINDIEARTRPASPAVYAHVSEVYSRATQGEPRCKCLLIQPLRRFLPPSEVIKNTADVATLTITVYLYRLSFLLPFTFCPITWENGNLPYRGLFAGQKDAHGILDHAMASRDSCPFLLEHYTNISLSLSIVRHGDILQLPEGRRQ
jgi:hypothetical protein